MSNLGLGQDPTVRVNGTLLANSVMAGLIDVRVEQSISVPSRFELRFLDPYFHLLDDALFGMGDVVEIAFALDQNTTVVVISGEVVNLASEQAADARHEMVVGGYDKSHRMAHDSQVRTFQNMSVKDIVAKLASEAGLGAQITASGAVSERRPYVLQTASDFALLDELAARVGYEWRVEATTLRFEPRLAKVGDVAKLVFGDELRRFTARYSSAEHDKQTDVRSWDPRTGKTLVGTYKSRTDDVGVVGSTSGLATTFRAGLAYGGTMSTSGPVVESKTEADALAKALGERGAGAEFPARGEAIGRPDLYAGAVVRIEGVGATLEGDYRLTAVEHVYGSGRPLRTKFSVAGVEASGLVDLLGVRSGALGPWGQHVGVTVGIVTNNKDPENLGRVRVKFPALTDTEESNWARVVGLGAGPQRGLVWTPSIQDEVLVAFEHGDLRRPHVIGSVWAAKQKPPATTTDFLEGQTVMQWMLRTQAGHQIVVEDGQAPTKRRVTISLADGKTKLHVGEDKVELVSNAKTLELSDGTAKITMDGRGGITISGTKVTIEAQQTAAVSGLEVSLTAKTTLKGSGAMLDLKADARGSIQASGPLALRGTPIQAN